MKKDIHPTYHKKATITCACGTKFIYGSTVEAKKTELCSACHPFYTGKQKLVDTARRVEKFEGKVASAKKMAGTKKGKTAKRAAKAKKTEAKATVKKTKK